MTTTPSKPVLLYGGAGWIGGQMRRLLAEEGTPFVLGSARADNRADVGAELDAVDPSLVVAALGRTHGVHDGRFYGTIDFLEQPGRLTDNVRDNLEAAVVLAALCHARRIPCAQIATGCIYEAADLASIADESAPGFTEDDPTNFDGSSYSTVKAGTDRLLRLFPNVLFFRIRMPITHDLHPRNFVTKIVNYEKICSIKNSMSVLDGPNGLLRLFLAMAQRGYAGCFNSTNPGVMSHNEILAMYQDKVDPTFTWQNFTAEEQSAVLAAGRSNNRLCSAKLSRAAEELGMPLPSLKVAVDGVMRAIAAQRECARQAEAARL
jgi:3,5-epimerase/4-reductase